MPYAELKFNVHRILLTNCQLGLNFLDSVRHSFDQSLYVLNELAHDKTHFIGGIRHLNMLDLRILFQFLADFAELSFYLHNLLTIINVFIDFLASVRLHFFSCFVQGFVRFLLLVDSLLHGLNFFCLALAFLLHLFL